MGHAVISNLFWAAALLGEAALMVALIRKNRWRTFPAFTASIGLTILVSVILLPIRWLHAESSYGTIYRIHTVLSFMLQIGIVVELARIVLRPTGTWVRDAGRQFLLSAAAGTVVALALAYMVAPPSASPMQDLELRGGLFTSLLISELFIAVSLASNRLGLGWQNHVMAIGQGFTAWSLVATIVDSLRSFFGASALYARTDYLQAVAYVAVLGYWTVQLWREEPARQPISPQLRKFILALHERVQYDLGEAER